MSQAIVPEWLHNPQHLPALHGLSLRGTSDDKLFSGDVVRKLLVQMEQQADVCQLPPLPPAAPSVAVTGRERASRRAVQHTVHEAEAEARAQQVAAHLGMVPK